MLDSKNARQKPEESGKIKNAKPKVEGRVEFKPKIIRGQNTSICQREN